MPEYMKTKKDFDAKLQGAGGKLVAVDFTASWCGPCRMIGPVFEAMEKDYPDVIFIKVDVDENDETAAAEKVEAMPTFKFYKNGKKIDEFCGADKNKLKEMVEKHK